MSEEGDWVDFKSENEDDGPFDTKSISKRSVRFSADTFSKSVVKKPTSQIIEKKVVPVYQKQASSAVIGDIRESKFNLKLNELSSPAPDIQSE